MATIPCPTCGLPRAEDLIGVLACPICGIVEADAIPNAPATAATTTPIEKEPKNERSPLEQNRSRFAMGMVLGFAIGLPLGIASVRNWPAGHPVDSRSVEGTAPTSVQEAAIAPAPREVLARAALPEESPPPRPVVAVAVLPQPIPPNPFRPAAPAAMRLENPDGESSPFVRPGGSLVLRGRVKKLIVRGLEAGARLDCSDLDADEIVVVGKIDGGSRLTIRAPNGTVTFHGGVDGDSRVSVRAKIVRFEGPIGGAGTTVQVELIAGGSLVFTELSGSARLEYSKADPAAADPIVTRGRVVAPAVVAFIE